MDTIINQLKSCILFKKYSPSEIEEIISSIKYEVKTYPKSEILALEGDHCSKLSIILKGNIDLQSLFPSGKVVTLAHLNESSIFGEALVFSSNNLYPITVITSTITTVLSINKEEILHLLSKDEIFLENFLSLLSNKLLFLNKKIKLLSLDSIRGKLCSYIIIEYKKQKTNKLTINLSKKALAEYLGVQRPSLSREFIKMKEDNLIDYDKDIIYIKDIELIENELLK